MGPMIPKEMKYNPHYGKVRGDVLQRHTEAHVVHTAQYEKLSQSSDKIVQNIAIIIIGTLIVHRLMHTSHICIILQTSL